MSPLGLRLAAFLLCCAYASPAHTYYKGLEGTFIKIVRGHQRLSDNPKLYLSSAVGPRIERYIEVRSPQRERKDPRLPNGQLAQKIATAAFCFEVDPYVLAALIGQESGFLTRAKSPTGAAGLTQFTDIAITEVGDQLGRRGNAHANPETIRYFRKAIQECVEGELLDGAPWVDLWKRPAVEAHAPFSGGWKQAQKTELIKDPDSALLYGAVLLKALVSWASHSLPGRDIEGNYRQALRRYNGDPPVMEKYQANIMSAAQKMLGR